MACLCVLRQGAFRGDGFTRGIDVGANAHIVKSSFDQGNPLDAILRLL